MPSVQLALMVFIDVLLCFLSIKFLKNSNFNNHYTLYHLFEINNAP